MKNNGFAANITNEEVAALPPVQFGGRVVIVDKPEAIGPACEDLAACNAIGFDTETRPSFKAGITNKVSLLQLSTPDRCYLFRLCRIPLDKRIIEILSSKTILKIGADTSGDLRGLAQLRHFMPAGFIDLQNIAAQWGIAEKSVRKLAAIVLGKKVSKAQRLSNWEAAALTPAQQSYAATDAWVCLIIHNELQGTEKKPLPKPASSPKQDADSLAKLSKKTRDKPVNKPAEDASAPAKARKFRWRVGFRRSKSRKEE